VICASHDPLLVDLADREARLREAVPLASALMATATVTVSGVRCERCIGRLAAALRNHEGIEYASANLMGEVALGWDEEMTSKDDIVAALARSGFPEIVTERE
jgi:copper chaperone CopZ